MCHIHYMDVNDTHILIVGDDKDYGLELKKSFVEIGKVGVVHSEDGFKRGKTDRAARTVQRN